MFRVFVAILIGIRDASVVTKGLAENCLTQKFRSGQIIATSHDLGLGPQMMVQ